MFFQGGRDGGTEGRDGKAKKKGFEELETQIRALKVGEGGMEGGEKYVVWATALVIIYLEKEWGEYEEEWEAAAKKAKRWLLRSVGGSEEQVEEGGDGGGKEGIGPGGGFVDRERGGQGEIQRRQRAGARKG